DPSNPKRMINGNDGGVDLTWNGGESWYTPPIPLAQFYHVAVDNATPYHVCGAMQDLGTAWGPSDSVSEAGIRNGDWFDVGGGEGLLHGSRDGGAHWDKVTPGRAPQWGTVDLIEASPFDAGTAYVVFDARRLDDTKPYLFKTTDFGRSWKSLSGGLPKDVY